MAQDRSADGSGESTTRGCGGEWWWVAGLGQNGGTELGSGYDLAKEGAREEGNTVGLKKVVRRPEACARQQAVARELRRAIASV